LISSSLITVFNSLDFQTQHGTMEPVLGNLVMSEWIPDETNDSDETELETDSRFPSGPWIGFFLDRRLARRNWMDLSLTFKGGLITGSGRDYVGRFGVSGCYNVEDGKCFWKKAYIGLHTVTYDGYNEGRGVWGIWKIVEDGLQGGFHVWPESMGDPSGESLEEYVDVPADETPVLLGAGVDDVSVSTDR
jgi:hypothetical protein